jgi:hypothetical protein
MSDPHATPREHEGDLSFEYPPGWDAQSVRVYSAPPSRTNPKQPAPNVVVRREALPAGVTLQLHAFREMTSIAKQLPSFELLDSNEARISGLPALVYRFEWHSPLGVLEQSSTMVESRGEDGKRILTTFLTSARKTDVAAARPFFGRILASIRFDKPNAYAPASRPAVPDAPAQPPFVPMPRSVPR